jgi:hypothetical protein
MVGCLMSKNQQKEPIILDPDPNNLIEEWSHQPKLYREWSTRLAKAKRKLRRRKAQLKLLEADLDAKIRKDPKKFGLAKLSEPAISNAIIREVSHQKAERVLNQTQYKVEVLEGVVESLDERKWALQNMVALFGDDYTAEPNAKPQNREAVNEKLKETARKKSQE